MFREYMHVEKYGNVEVQGIELGEVYVFPKLDGTNASTWFVCDEDGGRRVECGSRTRTLSADADNAGFFAACQASDEDGLGRRLFNFHSRHPHLRLYGEWLVPHTLKTYREDAWRRFWVFDVFNNETNTYLDYAAYKSMIEEFQLDFIPPLSKLLNPDYETFLHWVQQNVFFVKDGLGIGEGVVLKNYNFTNQFGNTVWAKIVHNQFKEEHSRVMGCPESERIPIEQRIAEQYVTNHLCDKEYAKIASAEGGWTSRFIPRLLESVYRAVVTEELYNVVSSSKPPPTINFGILKHFVISQVKRNLPLVF